MNKYRCWCPDDSEEAGAEVMDAADSRSAAEQYAEGAFGYIESLETIEVAVLDEAGTRTDWVVTVECSPTFSAKMLRKEQGK